ncbi:MAG: hypothetical protein K6T78_14655 [Alicyclobacillus sp.]|nr:hypothetical protein [Alicyclobacillus sp.]
MTPKMLIVAFDESDRLYVERSREAGFAVQVLDCLEPYHRRLQRWFGNGLLHVVGHREEVRAAVASEMFQCAIVAEGADYVQTGLIVQSLHAAGIPRVMVVTKHRDRRAVYRRLGAQVVLTADSPAEAWGQIASLLPSLATA